MSNRLLTGLFPPATKPAQASLARLAGQITPLAIFGFSLALNLATVWRKNFDGLYGQDPYSYYVHATELRYNFSLFHHWQWEAVPRLLYWPAGYPALVALLFLFTGASAGAAQLVSIVAWAGSCGLVAATGQKISGSWLAGVVAGGFMALSGWGRQVAVSVMADAPALFWTTLGVWLMLQAQEKRSGRYLAGAGLAFGLAGVTRYAALSAVPLLFIWATGRKLPAKWLVIALVAVGLVYLPQFIINQIFPSAFWTNSWLADWSPANAFQQEFTTRDGFASYPAPPLVFYLGFSLINPRFLTPLALPLVGLGVVRLWQKKAWFEAVWLGGWWLLPVLLFSGIPYENERFSLTFMPPVALLAGLGVVWLAGTLPKGWPQIGLHLALAASAIGLLVISQRHVDGFIAVKDIELAVVKQVEARLPAQANLITFDISLTFDHYTGLKVRDLSALDAGSVQTLASQPEVYLLADPANMAQQWKGNPIGVAFEAAQARAEGGPLAQFGRFYLWKLRRDG